MGFFSNFKASVLDDFIKPEKVQPGAIIRTDFLAGHHSGVVYDKSYYGKLQIADVTEIGNSHHIADVSAYNFIPRKNLHDDGVKAIFTTGLGGIFVACDSTGKVLNHKSIALRAEASLGCNYPDYSIKGKNCHMYSAYCIMGGWNFEQQFHFDLFPHLFSPVPSNFELSKTLNDLEKDGFNVLYRESFNGDSIEYYIDNNFIMLLENDKIYFTPKGQKFFNQVNEMQSIRNDLLNYAVDRFSNFNNLENAIKNFYNINEVRWLKIDGDEKDL